MLNISKIRKFIFPFILVSMTFGIGLGSKLIMVSLLIFTTLFSLFTFYYKRKISKEKVSFEEMWMPIAVYVFLLIFIFSEKSF